MRTLVRWLGGWWFFLPGTLAAAAPVGIRVDAAKVQGPVSRLLTGACIEDVNHEIYGGIYSQMIFGESFQEPAPTVAPAGFRAYGGAWRVEEGGSLQAAAGDGPLLVAEQPAFADGEVSVELWFPDPGAGNAGLAVRVSNPGVGADRFTGYEVSLDPGRQVLRLGRHRQNWEPIRDVACAVPVKEWIALTVRARGAALEVLVAGRTVLRHDDAEHPLAAGAVGLRVWQREARFRALRVTAGGPARSLAFQGRADDPGEISRMWQEIVEGDAKGEFGLETQRPFTGVQSQRLRMVSGTGAVGLENRGLNRRGMSFVAGKAYRGCLWARTAGDCELVVALETGDGAPVSGERRVAVAGGDEWRRAEFELTAGTGVDGGRFSVKLAKPGSVLLGHVFLEPGDWGLFKGLPVRRDVAEALIDQGITVLRYGGSMVNAPTYRWKNMIGPRDRRPPYRGTWYPYSSNGWGIIDFLALCKAAGFEAIPAFQIDESPTDMADFVDYVNGPSNGEWGRRRVADGHSEPFRLRYLQLGNEERVDDAYFRKFKALAAAIWAKDPGLILIVGDFGYGKPIRDPDRIEGAYSGIPSLDAHRRILALAREHGREVWFDVHVWTEGPEISADLGVLPDYVEAIRGIAGGAQHRVAVFEFNAGNHQLRRALANARAIHVVERLGLPVAASANCLQPDGHNDNGWDQGLLFLNPARVWLQPPGHVTRMVSRHYQPLRVAVETVGAAGDLDLNAVRSEDGRTLVLRVVNPSARPVDARIRLDGFVPAAAHALVETLSGPLDATNTADAPDRVKPRVEQWNHGLDRGSESARVFPPHSFSVLRFE
jgi:alpha-L-arabinofuranosidase